MPLRSAPTLGIRPIRVGPEVKTRDSILLTYFVDAGLVRYLRNRGKRLGNFVLNELRNTLP